MMAVALSLAAYLLLALSPSASAQDPEAGLADAEARAAAAETDATELEPVARLAEAKLEAAKEQAAPVRLETELIADRVWRTRSQLELAVVEYVAWFNNDRLHESLGDVSPAEFESLYAAKGDRRISLKMKIGSN
jgi:Integrase core domain